MMDQGHPVARLRLEIEGAVQGVGFRPFVYRLARDLGLAGSVVNDARGVVIEVERCEVIPTPPSGKRRFTISDVPGLRSSRSS